MKTSPAGAPSRVRPGEAGFVTSLNQSRLIQPTLLVVYDRQKRLYRKPFDVDLKNDERLRIIGILDPKSYGFDFGKFI